MNLNPITTNRFNVLNNHFIEEIFPKAGPDFYCGGGMGNEEAIRTIEARQGRESGDSDKIPATSPAADRHVNTYDADFLIDYIIQNHHRYIRSVFPSILRYALKVARNHGGSRPDLIEIGKIFTRITNDLEVTMTKVEQILFPYIKALIRAHREQAPFPVAPFSTISHLVHAATMEHEQAERLMAAIRELSNNYTLPTDACMSCHILFRELEDFEHDLHSLMHMEDYVLFPKALALEEQSRRDMPT